MRTIAAAIIIFAGVMGVALGDIARSLGGAGGDAMTVGGFVLAGGVLLLILDARNEIRAWLKDRDILFTGRPLSDPPRDES